MHGITTPAPRSTTKLTSLAAAAATTTTTTTVTNPSRRSSAATTFQNSNAASLTASRPTNRHHHHHPLKTPYSTIKTAPHLERAADDRFLEPERACPEGDVPVILVLDPMLQSIPWESLPSLTAQRVYRIPSLPCVATAAIQRYGGGAARTCSPPPPAVHLSSAFYALNPCGDLTTTQDTFQAWFEGLQGWEGTTGTAPTAAQLATALETKDLFVYCGHGSGEQYIPIPRLRALSRCALSLLMGCSSGRLRSRQPVPPIAHPRGRYIDSVIDPLSSYYYYDPSGAVLAYVLAGCPVVVANLWDVTDKDIDRFCQALLLKWLSSAASLRNEGEDSVRRSNTVSVKSPVADGVDVAWSVRQARSACKLRSLIGAAPVCYGIPTAVAAPSKHHQSVRQRETDREVFRLHVCSQEK